MRKRETRSARRFPSARSDAPISTRCLSGLLRHSRRRCISLSRRSVGTSVRSAMVLDMNAATRSSARGQTASKRGDRQRERRAVTTRLRRERGDDAPGRGAGGGRGEVRARPRPARHRGSARRRRRGRGTSEEVSGGRAGTASGIRGEGRRRGRGGGVDGPLGGSGARGGGGARARAAAGRHGRERRARCAFCAQTLFERVCARGSGERRGTRLFLRFGGRQELGKKRSRSGERESGVRPREGLEAYLFRGRGGRVPRIDRSPRCRGVS